jgi:hypothetical protein
MINETLCRFNKSSAFQLPDMFGDFGERTSVNYVESKVSNGDALK